MSDWPVEGDYVDDARTVRPRFHFAPARNWMNDPNGLVHHDGEWHLFFQHNPYGADWGSTSWGHAVSTDLARWTELPVALPATEEEMAFSGSVVVDGDTLAALYTAFRPAEKRQSQALATSTDRGRTWTPYAGNPVLIHEDPDFRDPKVFRHDGHWVMAVALSLQRRIAFYRSDDLRTWEPLSTFGPAHATGGIWEMPDLFPLPVDGTDRVKWVLSVGLDPGAVAGGSGTQYFVGDFDGTTFTADGAGWADYGTDFYAAASFENVPDRRVWLAWMSNWLYAKDVPTSPWRGAMTVPRELTLRTVDGEVRLVQEPLLATEPVGHGDGLGELPPGDLIEVDVEVGPGTEVGVEVLGGTRVGWRDARLFVERAGFRAGRYDGPLPARDGRVRFRVLVDRCSVEVFGGAGETVLTCLVIPPVEEPAPRAYAAGGPVTVRALDVARWIG